MHLLGKIGQYLVKKAPNYSNLWEKIHTLDKIGRIWSNIHPLDKIGQHMVENASFV